MYELINFRLLNSKDPGDFYAELNNQNGYTSSLKIIYIQRTSLQNSILKCELNCL